MNPNGDELRRYYGELVDEALLAINPDDLTDLARQYYQVELDHRGLRRPLKQKPVKENEPESSTLVLPESEFSLDGLPWKSDAVSVASYNRAEDAEQGRDVLERAGIPCALTMREVIGYQLVLMVPSSLREKAQETLRAEIYQPEIEHEYANHFVEFSDDELLDVDTQQLPEIGRQYYAAELKKRGLEQSACRDSVRPLRCIRRS